MQLSGAKLDVFYMKTTGANASLPRLPGTRIPQSGGVAEVGLGCCDNGRREIPYYNN